MSSQNQQDHKAPQDKASQEEAQTQLKAQFSNLFSFFTKVPSNISTSSSNLKEAIVEKASLSVVNILKNREAEKAKDLKQKLEVPIDNESEKKEEANEEKPHAKTPEAHKKEHEHKKEEAPRVAAPRFTSFLDVFGSMGKFLMKTTEGVKDSSVKMVDRFKQGIDLTEKNKKKAEVPPAKAEAQPKEAKNKAPPANKAEKQKKILNNEEKKRLEEVKRMKEEFEKKLKSLDKEIKVLEKLEKEDNNESEGSNRQNPDKKKNFRINQGNSQKSLREVPDKNLGKAKSPKQGKMLLPPLEEGKPPLPRKWNEGEKSAKALVKSDQPPLYMRMEKEFLQNVVYPELEARKEKLKVKREFYKPIEDKELREHAIKYEEKKKNLVGLHVEKVDKENAEKIAKVMKSQAYKKVLEQEKEDKVKAEQKADEKKQLKEKQTQYAKLVKEMFFPKVESKEDLLSKENLEQIIELSKKAGEAPVMAATVKETRNTYKPLIKKKRSSQDLTQQPEKSPERMPPIKHNYLRRDVSKSRSPARIVEESTFQSVKRRAAQKKVSSEEGQNEEEKDIEKIDEEKKEEEVVVKPKTKKPRVASVSPKKEVKEGEDEVKKEVEPEKKPYPNYLTEVRQKRIEQEKKLGKNKYSNWEKVLNNKGLSEKEKVMNILDDITKIEFQAKLKEDKLKRHNGTEPGELEDEVGEMYLESIKAKLAVLQKL